MSEVNGIVYGKITYDKGAERTVERVREVAPYVDYCVIVCDDQRPYTEEQKKELNKFDNVIYMEKPYEDNMPRFRNYYIEEALKLKQEEGWDNLWMAVSDSDEILSEKLRKNLRQIVDEAEDAGATVIGTNCQEQFEGMEWTDDLDLLKQCFDEETEVFTDNGWKHYYEINDKDRVYALNEHGYAEFQKPTHYIQQYHKGKMILYEGKSVNFCVTPNHRMVVKKHHDAYNKPKYNQERIKAYKKAIELHKKHGMGHRKIGKKLGISPGTVYEWLHNGVKPWRKEPKSYHFLTAEECYQRTNLKYLRNYGRFEAEEKKYFTLSGCWDGDYWVPPIDIPMEDWLRFFGFWLGDGWATRSSEVGINQSKYIKYVEKILSKIPFKWNSRTRRRDSRRLPNTDYRLFNRQLFKYLSKFGKTGEKYIPQDIKNLSGIQLDILLHSFILAEGNRNGNGHQVGISGKQLADDIQEIAVKAGYGTTLRKAEWGSSDSDFYVVDISNSTEIRSKEKLKHSNNRRENKIEYDGVVWCVTVPNEIVLTRRNGRTLWTGNSPAYYRGSDHYKELIFKICCGGLRYWGIGQAANLHESWGCPQHALVPTRLPKEYFYIQRKSSYEIWRNACLTPDTKIIADGELKRVDEVNIGDSVLSKDGKFHRVLDVWSRHYEGKIVRLQTHYGLKAGFTPDHKIMALSPIQAYYVGLDKGLHKSGSAHPVHGLNPDWVEACYCKDEIFAFPRPVVNKYEPNVIKSLGYDPRDWKVNKIPEQTRKLMKGKKGEFGGKELREVTYNKVKSKKNIQTEDKDFWFFCGAWLAEGSFDHKRDKEYNYNVKTTDRGYEREYNRKITGPGQIKLSIHINDILKDDLFRIIEEKFNRTPSTQQRGNLLTVHFGNRPLAEFLDNTFGRGSSSKNIPLELLGLKQSLLASLIEGMFKGDGTKTESGWTLSTTNRQFVGFLILALTKYSIIPGIREVNTKSGYGGNRRKKLYHVSVSDNEWNTLMESKKGRHFKTKNNLCWSDANYIYVPSCRKGWHQFKEENYSGPVYDLTIEDEVSFTLPYMTVHNSRNMFISGGGDSVSDLNPLWTELRDICRNKLNIYNWKEMEEFVESDQEIPQVLVDWIKKALRYSASNWGIESRQLCKWIIFHNRDLLDDPDIKWKAENPPELTEDDKLELEIKQHYFDVLKRPPDREGLENYKALVKQGKANTDDISELLKKSDEYKEKVEPQERDKRQDDRETMDVTGQVRIRTLIDVDDETLIKLLKQQSKTYDNIERQRMLAEIIEDSIEDVEEFYKDLFKLKEMEDSDKDIVQLIKNHLHNSI